MKRHLYVYILVLILSSVLLSGCTKKESEETDTKTDTSVTEQEETEEEKPAEEKPVEEKEESPQDSSSLEGFGKEKVVLGQASDFEYTLDSIETKEGEGYYEFTFKISSSQEGAVTPLFTVTPLPSKGVFRVSLTNIFDDNSTITHSKGVTINKGAITALTRIVTDSDTTRGYDIGVQGNNQFKVDVTEEGSSTWVFSVKVSYDTNYTAPVIDFGSTKFSSEPQKIEGVTSQQGAKITDYSYIYSGGILKFSLEVASGASNPIPSLTAQYNDEGVLVVNFSSLEQDKVSQWGSVINLPAGVKVEISRTGQESVYMFSGINNRKPFRISASQSPNLVNIEIDL
jgi:hypothetical protein